MVAETIKGAEGEKQRYPLGQNTPVDHKGVFQCLVCAYNDVMVMILSLAGGFTCLICGWLAEVSKNCLVAVHHGRDSGPQIRQALLDVAH